MKCLAKQLFEGYVGSKIDLKRRNSTKKRAIESKMASSGFIEIDIFSSQNISI